MRARRAGERGFRFRRDFLRVWILMGVAGLSPSPGPAATRDLSTFLSFSAQVVDQKPLVFPSNAPASIVSPHRPLRLRVSFQGQAPILGVTLRYRRLGELAYGSDAMTPLPEGRTSVEGFARIPPAALDRTGVLEYYFDVRYAGLAGERTVQWPYAGSRQILDVKEFLEVRLDRSGGRVAVPDGDVTDGETFVDFPPDCLPGVVNLVVKPLAAQAPFGGPAATAPAAAGGANVVSAVSFTTDRQAALRRPATIGLVYADFDQDGWVDDAGVREEDLAAFWWDGVHWRPQGKTTLDAEANVASFRANFLGTFALMVPGAPGEISYRPMEMVSTPNGDGVNDQVVFDGFTSGVRIVILDQKGRVVREFSDTNAWDGRDGSGKMVESGLYVYQIHSDRGIMSGAIAVAK